MATYLTETVYQRWYYQHQMNLGYCIALLNHLRVRLEALPYDSDVVELENIINDIDDNIEQVKPRDFSVEPLVGAEMFFENMKVLFNLLTKLGGSQNQLKGIYQKEKERILNNHQMFKFKENLKNIRERIESIEAQNYSDEIVEDRVADQNS